MRTLKNILSAILFILLLLTSVSAALPVQKGESRYKVAACDWMILKRQKVGAFKLVREMGGDGVELDMGSLGNNETFSNKLLDPSYRQQFADSARKYKVDISSIAMSGFYGQSFLTRENYKELVQECLATMEAMNVKTAFLPLGGSGNKWNEVPAERKELVRRLKEVGDMAAAKGLTIGIETHLDAAGDVKLLEDVNSPGIKIYFHFQNALDNGRNLYKELNVLGKNRICQIHSSDGDGVTLPYNKRLDMKKVKKHLDKMGWSGWLVVERSRDTTDVRNVKKNYGTNIRYLKKIFQQK